MGLRPGLALPRPAEWLDLAWLGLAWLGLAWLGLVWFRLLGRLVLLLSRTQFLFAFPFPYSSSSITTLVSCTIPGIYRY